MSTVSNTAKANWKSLILVVLIVTITRVLFLSDSGMLNSVDAYWFVGGAIDFDLREIHPHLPGYYLYVKLLGILNGFGLEFKTASILLSVVAEAAAAVLFFLGVARAGSKSALWLCLSLLMNPAVWYYGLVGETYPIDLLATSGIIYLWNTEKGGYLIFPWLVFMAGFRPSIAVFLLPAALIALYYQRDQLRDKFVWFTSFATALMITILWLFPILEDAGWVLGYLELYRTHTPLTDFGIVANVVNFASYAIWWFPPIMYLVLRNWKRIIQSDIFFKILFSMILPLLFFMLYHYSKGYILLVLPFIYFLFRDADTRDLIISVLISVMIFFLAPSSYLPVELDMNRQFRTTTKIENLYYRSTSTTNTTYSALVFKTRLMDQYHDIIGKLKPGISTLWLDRSNYINAGEIAYFYPELQVRKMELNSYDNNYSNFYQWSVSYPEASLSEISDGLFIGRKDFVEDYLSGYVEVKVSNDLFASYEVIQGREQDYYDLIYNYFTPFSPEKPLVP